MTDNPEDWVETDTLAGGLVSRVPEGYKGLHIGDVPLNNGAVAIPMLSTAETLKRVPHGGKPMAQIKLPMNITYRDFKTVLSGAYLSYIGGVEGGEEGEGSGPTVADVKRYVGDQLTETTVRNIMATDAFRAACEARGIALAARPGLTPEQDLALTIITDPTAGKGLAQRLRKAKVTMGKYRAWMRNPVFRRHVEQMGQGVLKEYENEMLTSLAGAAVDGDLNAIKFAFEVTGKHNPNANEVMNVREILLEFMHIVQRHVKDPEALQSIGSEIMMLTGASGANTPNVPINKEIGS